LVHTIFVASGEEAWLAMLSDDGNSQQVPFVRLDSQGSDDGRSRSRNLLQSFSELLAVDNRCKNRVGLPDKEKRQAAFDAYVQTCGERCVKPDGGISICLKVGLDTLRPDGQLTNWELMAMADIMQQAPWVQNLKLAKQPVGDTGVALLAREVLPDNGHITHLDLKMANMTSVGTIILCDELPRSQLQMLSLSANTLCGQRSANAVAAALRDAISQTSSLQKVDLSRCNLSEQAMRTIKAGQALRVERGFRECELDFTGNFLVIEVMNSLSHAVGVVVAIIFAACLACKSDLNKITSKAALAVYVGSLITMFLNSTLYHSLFYIISSHFVMQALDHTGIYLLIAGSYTPVMALGCDAGFRTAIMVILYWLLAAVGVGMAIYAPWPKPTWYERGSLVLYVVMGIGGAPFILLSEHCLPVRELIMKKLLAGGAAFLCGVPFFVSSAGFPTLHIIWHIFVLVGCCFMMCAVWTIATHDGIERVHQLLNGTVGHS